jgi:DNA ligase (NAD+)
MNDREKFLIQTLTEARNVYYNTGETILSDNEYDKLKEELHELNPNSDFFLKVEFKSRYGTPVVHEHRMRSIQKANCFEDIQKYAAKMPEVEERLWEHKIDGVSIELEYNNRKLITASTRGDGKTGQDVTHTVNWIPNIPQQILFDKHVYIRGECVLPRNTKFDTKGKPFRDIASELIERKDGHPDCSYLRFISYNVISSKIKFTTEIDKLSFLLEQGFDVVPHGKFNSLETLQKIYIEYYTKIRDQLPYEIDGLIILPNEISMQEKYEDGNEHHPLWAIAYKFPN